VPFLIKNVGQIFKYFCENPDVEKEFPIVTFDSGVKDSKNRPLSWKISGSKKQFMGVTCFSLELYTKKKVLCSLNFQMRIDGPDLCVFIGYFASDPDERQSGFGRVVLSSLITVFSKLHTRVYLALAAEPLLEKEEDQIRFSPILIAFYKSFGFRAGLNERNLFLWIIDGKIQKASDFGALEDKW
jgi:hypothetical protein